MNRNAGRAGVGRECLKSQPEAPHPRGVRKQEQKFLVNLNREHKQVRK